METDLELTDTETLETTGTDSETTGRTGSFRKSWI